MNNEETSKETSNKVALIRPLPQLPIYWEERLIHEAEEDAYLFEMERFA